MQCLLQLQKKFIERYNTVKQNPELYNDEVYMFSFDPPSVIIETIGKIV
jgi:hypothetical protein